MKKGLRLFTPLDIVAPWLVCLGSTGLCVWAFIAGTPGEGGDPISVKVVSAIVGVIFLSVIPLWYFVRSRKTKVDFTTRHGIGCVWGKRNKPARLLVEQWTDKIIQHWSNTPYVKGRGKVQLNLREVMSALKDTICFFVDKEKLSVWGRFVRGYTQGPNFVIGWRADSIEQQGTTDTVYVRNLFDHELGHVILGFNGEGWDEKHHHEIQAKVGTSFAPDTKSAA